MRGFIKKVLKMLNLSGREWIILLLALLLASSIWLIHKLSLEYNVYLSVDVVAESNIEGRAKTSSSGAEVMAKCRTTGWRILYAYMTRNNSVRVKFPSSMMHHDGEDRFYVASDRLHEYVEDIFGSNVSVDYFVADKVYFKFQEEVYKKVPVRPVSSLSFDTQYVPTTPLQVIPDSVTVYGDEMHLEALEYVTTATIKHASVTEDLNGMISLTPIKGMRFSVDEVHYKMDVVRYVEIECENVPVEVINTPPGKQYVADPLYVDVTLECEFPLKANPKKGLYLVADYDEYRQSISGNVIVKPSALPFGTINHEISPVFVKVREDNR